MSARGARPTPECAAAHLFECVEAGDCAQVASLIAQRVVAVDVRQWTPRRISPGIDKFWPRGSAEQDCQAVHCAAAAGKLDALRVLLDLGASAEARTRGGMTPLHLAALGAHPHVVAALCALPPPGDARRAYVEAPMGASADGPTALHLCLAAKRALPPAPRRGCATRTTTNAARPHADRLATLDALLDAGADPNTPAPGGITPLHVAAASLDAHACARLVRAGAWVQATDEQGCTPLDKARGAAASAEAIAREYVMPPEDRAAMKAMAAAAPEVVAALQWLPSVRLLWLGHVSGAAQPGARMHDDGDGAEADETAGAVASPLRSLTRDALRLVCAAVVAAHSPPRASQC